MRASSLIAAITLTASIALAQTAPPPGEQRAKVGYVRFWDMLPAANGKFVLRKIGSPAADGPSLSASAYQYSGYTEFPAARMRMGVYKDTDPNTAIRTLDIDLKPGTFFTVLIAPQPNGGGNVELIDDTILPESPAGTLTIRNYFPGLTISAAAPGQNVVHGLSYGQSYTATGLGAAVLPLTLRTRLANGTPAESGAEVDFKDSKRSTVLVIPDSYGRFRPRVTADGKVN